MRILNKTQLILESNLDFLGLINIVQTNPKKNEIQPMIVLYTLFQFFNTAFIKL